MKERLKLVGGELFIESQSTRGTTVSGPGAGSAITGGSRDLLGVILRKSALRNTALPPTIVIMTRICSMRLAGTVMMSSGSTTKSAKRPGAIIPFVFSSNVSTSGCGSPSAARPRREIFWSTPMGPPEIVSRVTKW